MWYYEKPKMEGLYLIDANPSSKPVEQFDWDKVDWVSNNKDFINWSQLTRLEAVKLHVRLIEEAISGLHQYYFWLDNTEPVYMIDEIRSC